MRKINSANYANEQQLLEGCPISSFFHVLGGRWKLSILWNLREGPLRFSDLQERLPTISDKMLSQQLKKLWEDNFVEREVISSQIPVKVSYSLTSKGKALIPVLSSIYDWGADWILNR